MQTFKNILFAADHSEGSVRALTKLLDFAEHFDAKVTVMDVIPDYSGQYLYPELEGSASALRAALTEDGQAQLDALIKEAFKRCSKLARQIPVDTLIREGIDYIEYIREVKAGGYDLLAKAANNNAGLAARLFGTLDMQLLRKCPCPVLVLKPRKKIDHARILAAVDLNRTTKARSNLDRVVMDMASSLAGMEDGTLDILHVWNMPYEKKLKNEERVGLYESLDKLSKEMRAVEKQHLQALAADYALLKPLTHLMKGAPEKVVAKFSKTHRTDLVVMGTVGRTGVAGFFVGNTAEKILHSLECSVLAVKPDGYKTPVK